MTQKNTLSLPDRIIRKKEYMTMLGVSSTTFWRMEQRGILAPRRQISIGVHGWLLSEALERIKAV
jgi:predicted DNA-binding transcriptional regulator AlpA